MSFLDAKNITMQFGGLTAVDGATFHVDKGEIVSLIGPNGAGKTTVFNMLTGVYHITSGEMTFEGQDLTKMIPQDIVKIGISRTFQNLRLFPKMRVIENVLVGTHIRNKYNFWDSLLRTDREAVTLTNWENIIQITQAGTGVYYVDGASLKVFYADFADWKPYNFLDLVKEDYDLDDCTDLWVTRDGDVLLLMEGNTLLLDRGSTVSDLSGMLCRPSAQCVLILGGIALGVLVLTVLLWFAVCEQRQFRLPLLVRWGVLFGAVALLGTAILVRGVIRPASQRMAQREAAALLQKTCALQTAAKTVHDALETHYIRATDFEKVNAVRTALAQELFG